MKIVIKIVFTLFGLMFINAGLDKFLHYMPIPELEPELINVGEAFMSIRWIMPLVGAVELLSGILFIFPKTRFLGAIMLFPVMVGIMLHNAIYMPEGLAIAGVLFLIQLVVLYENKEKIKGLMG